MVAAALVVEHLLLFPWPFRFNFAGASALEFAQTPEVVVLTTKEEGEGEGSAVNRVESNRVFDCRAQLMFSSSQARTCSTNRTSLEVCSNSTRQMGHVTHARARTRLVYHKRVELELVRIDHNKNL